MAACARLVTKSAGWLAMGTLYTCDMQAVAWCACLCVVERSPLLKELHLGADCEPGCHAGHWRGGSCKKLFLCFGPSCTGIRPLLHRNQVLAAQESRRHALCIHSIQKDAALLSQMCSIIAHGLRMCLWPLDACGTCWLLSRCERLGHTMARCCFGSVLAY